MAELQPSKLVMRVRFPSPAPHATPQVSRAAIGIFPLGLRGCPSASLVGSASARGTPVPSSVVVEPTKDLCELAIVHEAREHFDHGFDTGVPNDQAIPAPEVAAVQGLPALGPPL